MFFLTFIACTSRQINAMLAEQGNLYSIFASTPGEGSPFWYFLTASLKVLGVRMIVGTILSTFATRPSRLPLSWVGSSVWKFPLLLVGWTGTPLVVGHPLLSVIFSRYQSVGSHQSRAFENMDALCDSQRRSASCSQCPQLIERKDLDAKLLVWNSVRPRPRMEK